MLRSGGCRNAHFVMFDAGKDEKQESVLASNRSTPYIEVLQLFHTNRLPLTNHFLPCPYNDTYSLSSQTTWVHPEMLPGTS